MINCIISTRESSENVQLINHTLHTRLMRNKLKEKQVSQGQSNVKGDLCALACFTSPPLSDPPPPLEVSL